MGRNPFVRSRKKERGQTVAIVAFSLISLLAMAALAIDVASLYSARAEAQRAADAVALAGAKAFVDSGFTTTPNNPDVKTLAENMANGYINAALSQNNVAGTPPTIQGPPTFDDTTHPGNPIVTVKVQQTNLPIFFSKIWGVSLLSVSATAVAEAYNPSSSQGLSSTGNQFVASAPSCVKPLAIPNEDPNRGNAQFVDPGSGAVNPAWTGTGGFIGEQITLNSACQPRRGGRRGPGVTCTLPAPATAGQYVPLQPPASTNMSCPSCARGGSSVEQSLECCDMNVYKCGKNSTGPDATAGYAGYNNFTTYFSLQRCAMESLGLPDTLDPTSLANYPNGPLKIIAGSGPATNDPNGVTTSNSIMTFPVFDSTSGTVPNGTVNVIGFLQVFVDNVQFNGQINAHILNVVGCGDNPSAATPVSGGGTSPIPVRLIHN